MCSWTIFRRICHFTLDCSGCFVWIIEHNPLSVALLENYPACQWKDALNHQLLFIHSSSSWEGGAAPPAFTHSKHATGASVKAAVTCVDCHLFSDFLDLRLLVDSDDNPSASSNHFDMSPSTSVAFRTLSHAYLYSTPFQSLRHDTKTFFCSTGDVPKWKLKYFEVAEILWHLKWFLAPSWPEHHPAALMLLCGHAALSKPACLFAKTSFWGPVRPRHVISHRWTSDNRRKHSYYIV